VALRSRIAERLKTAQDTAAILTTFNECDMSAVMALRNQHKADWVAVASAVHGSTARILSSCVRSTGSFMGEAS
jgi:2-oxoglutarate dehydrogenase E2 component (dihydrolipoamide succinyltransferase)